LLASPDGKEKPVNEKEAAESICDIIRTTGEDGRTMMIGALAMFFDKEFGSKDEFAEGLAYAEKAGRIKFPKAKYGLLERCPGRTKRRGKGKPPSSLHPSASVKHPKSDE
jgi:hypothetical protein